MPITAFSDQRLRCCGPISRELAVIHHNPPASIGSRMTWPLLAASVSATKPGMPGRVQISGGITVEIAIQR